MEQQPQIDIVMTSWNRPRFTRYTVEALHKNTTHPYRLIVVDNGSDSISQEVLFELKRMGWIHTLVMLDKNYGLEYAKHRAMTFVESPLFVSTDNDILAYQYDPDWLHRMVWLMQAHPDYGAIACRPQILVGTGNIFDKRIEDVIEFSHVPGYLRIMRTNWVKEVGSWGDERPLRGHEEYWISEKLREMGKKVGWANNVKCWHLFGKSNWGYGELPVEEHGHSPISSLPGDDREEIFEKTGIDIGV